LDVVVSSRLSDVEAPAFTGYFVWSLLQSHVLSVLDGICLRDDEPEYASPTVTPGKVHSTTEFYHCDEKRARWS
jgi:hypothetical protein